MILSTAVGPLPIPAITSWWIFFHQLTGGAFPAAACPPGTSVTLCGPWTEIVWAGRVPPLVLAVCAGAALAVSGGALQGVFRNPLVDPYLLGLSTGAAVGAGVLFAFGPGTSRGGSLLPVFTFLGGLVPGVIIYLAAGGRGRTIETLLLTGVALNFLFSGVLDILLLYNPTSDQQVSFWLLGGLSAASWPHDATVLGVLLVAGALISLHARALNVLQLGPDVAESVGVAARATARNLILLATVLTAVAVSFTGVIGFVGLVSPHVVRRVLGPDYRRVLPTSAVVGGVFLVLAWDLAQSVIPLVVIPVGIPTAFAGVPFFLYLLYRGRRVGGGAR